MDELLTYSLTDLLMFTPHTYARLFELYNHALWPAHLLAGALTLWLIVASHHANATRSRIISLLLAAVWAVIAWFFFVLHYATIHLAAPWFALGFALQALLLAVAGLMGQLHYAWRAKGWGHAGLGLLLIASVLMPLTALWSGREWRSIELFALTPDPTALGTVGLLLMTRGKSRWLLLPLPLAWCAITLLTHLAMTLKG